MTQEQNSDKQRSSNRILVLRPKEGTKAISSTGLVDHRLFKSENSLHAIMDESTCLWRMKYEQGMVPSELRQAFTSFKKLKDHAERYYNARNIEIKEVQD
jgi:hypothetical protein